MEVKLHYDGGKRTLEHMVSIGINGILGEPLALCSTRITGQDLDTIPRRGHSSVRFRACRSSQIVTRSTSTLRSNGVLADWVQDAHMFDVTESDFFGSGQLPPKTHGRFVLDHSWSVAHDELRSSDVSVA